MGFNDEAVALTSKRTRTLYQGKPRQEVGHKRINQFLNVLKTNGSIGQACQASNISPAQVKKMLKSSLSFENRYNSIMTIAVAPLEIEARRRALGFTDANGKFVYSDPLLSQELKRRMPEEYDRPSNRTTHSIQTSVNLADILRKSDSHLATLEKDIIDV